MIKKVKWNINNGDVIALSNGTELRQWTERQSVLVRPSVIRCATYTVNYHGLSWLLRLAGHGKVTVKVLCDVSQRNADYGRWIEESLQEKKLEIRVAPARLGPMKEDPGLFHAKMVILAEETAVVGSANLTGKALEIGPKPYNIEVSIGLTGISLQGAVAKLVQYFDEWWETALPLTYASQNEEQETDPMDQSKPEYIVFQCRPNWGIAEIQTEGTGLFGQEKWLAISDLSPANPERRAARLQVPSRFIESIKPQPWVLPAEQITRVKFSAIKHKKEHFWRLAAYWLQAENRQGQLDSLPVLQLRHQTSLVEYLSRPHAPREVLIADEVGLGKTVELGLLLARLRAAQPSLRILYITPGGLVTNVVDEFKNMGLEDTWVYANISLDEQEYPKARLGRKEHDNWVVASLHRLGWRKNADVQLRETEWDVVIADECHRLRMYGTGETQNAQPWFRLVERIVKKHMSESRRVYFLSGTPHQGNREVFLNLVAMMCGLERQASQQQKEQALAGRVIYRTKEEIRDWENRPVFPERDVRAPSYASIPSEYNDLLREIANYFNNLMAFQLFSHGLGNEGGNQGRALGFVKSHALQFAASSPKAGFTFLLRRLLRLFDNETAEKTLLKWVSLLIPYRHWSETQKPQRLLEELRRSVRDTEDEEVVGEFGGSTAKPHEHERVQLSKLLNKYALLLSKPEANAKFDVLMELIDSADEPFVVFAQSVDTVYEVKRHVEKNGIPCCLIVGGQNPNDRRKIIHEFTSSARLGRRVLVSSSAGGEGINLQISRRLIHFDLPWNPMVLEQRIGRGHRIGSGDTVIVDTILLEGSREADIYERLMKRLLAIVDDLTDDERLRGQYFRRIMAGIPLDMLRELFGGNVSDQNEAIGRAVDKGRQHVDQIDKELRDLRVQKLPEEKGRAEMRHLVELLKLSKKIKEKDSKIKYTRVEFDDKSESFRGVSGFAEQFEFKDGQPNSSNKWVVFDREAAARATEVGKQNSGGIDHPIVSLALQSLRTPKDIGKMSSLTLGIGVFDRGYIEVFSNGNVEPVIMLSYVSARLSGNYYFDHEIHLFALSASNPEVEKLGREDGELIEQFIWSNIRYEGPRVVCPKLDSALIDRLVKDDLRIRQELVDDVRNENGRWIGAVWPLAATVLVPK